MIIRDFHRCLLGLIFFASPVAAQVAATNLADQPFAQTYPRLLEISGLSREKKAEAVQAEALKLRIPDFFATFMREQRLVDFPEQSYMGFLKFAVDYHKLDKLGEAWAEKPDDPVLTQSFAVHEKQLIATAEGLVFLGEAKTAAAFEAIMRRPEWPKAGRLVGSLGGVEHAFRLAIQSELLKSTGYYANPALEIAIDDWITRFKHFVDIHNMTAHYYDAHRNLHPQLFLQEEQDYLNNCTQHHDDMLVKLRAMLDQLAAQPATTEQKKRISELREAINDINFFGTLKLPNFEENMRDFQLTAPLVFAAGLTRVARCGWLGIEKGWKAVRGLETAGDITKATALANQLKASSVAYSELSALAGFTTLTSFGAYSVLKFGEGNVAAGVGGLLPIGLGLAKSEKVLLYAYGAQQGLAFTEAIDFTWNRQGVSNNLKGQLEQALRDQGWEQSTIDKTSFAVIALPTMVAGFFAGKHISKDGLVAWVLNKVGINTPARRTIFGTAYLPTCVLGLAASSQLSEHYGPLQQPWSNTRFWHSAADMAWGTSPYATFWLNSLRSPTGQWMAGFAELQEGIEDLDPAIDSLLTGFPAQAGLRVVDNVIWDVADTSFPAYRSNGHQAIVLEPSELGAPFTVVLVPIDSLANK